MQWCVALERLEGELQGGVPGDDVFVDIELRRYAVYFNCDLMWLTVFCLFLDRFHWFRCSLIVRGWRCCCHLMPLSWYRPLRATGRDRGAGTTFGHGGGPEMTGSIKTSGSGRGPRRDWILLYCWFLCGPPVHDLSLARNDMFPARLSLFKIFGSVV